MDRGASAGFEQIAEKLLEQKKLMDALEAENRELRRQLAELRRGVGIAVVIEGKTVQLATGASEPMYQSGLGALAPSPAVTQVGQLNPQMPPMSLSSPSGSFPGASTPGSLPVP